jgi:hypothetical protein
MRLLSAGGEGGVWINLRIDACVVRKRERLQFDVAGKFHSQ